MAQHAKLKLTGLTTADARIQFVSMLQVWCPLYGAQFFTVRCQLEEPEKEKASKRKKNKARQGG